MQAAKGERQPTVQSIVSMDHSSDQRQKILKGAIVARISSI